MRNGQFSPAPHLSASRRRPVGTNSAPARFGPSDRRRRPYRNGHKYISFHFAEAGKRGDGWDSGRPGWRRAGGCDYERHSVHWARSIDPGSVSLIIEHRGDNLQYLDCDAMESPCSPTLVALYKSLITNSW